MEHHIKLENDAELILLSNLFLALQFAGILAVNI